MDEPTRTTTRENFEYWLADMDDALERFFWQVPDPIREKLDYSASSLDVLEQWLLERYPSTQAMLVPAESQILNGIARYVGETLRKTVGGRWNIQLDDPAYAFHGLPEITGFSERATPECPITLATAAADRRKGDYLRTIVEALKRRYRP